MIDNSRDDEVALLSGILNDNKSYWSCLDVQEIHFTDGALGRLFVEMGRMMEAGEVVNALTLRDFTQTILPPEESAMQFLISLENCGVGSTAIYSARKVIENYKKREILEKMMWVQGEASSGNIKTSEDLISELMNTCIEQSSISRSKISSFRDTSQSIISEMEVDVPLYKSGLKSLDLGMGGGFYQGKSYFFGAPAKGRKTTLLHTIADNISKEHDVMYICAEMGKEEIHKRVLARACGVNPLAFLSPKNKKVLAPKLINAVPTQSETSYYVDYPSIPFSELKKIVMLGIKKYKVKGVFLDYFQLVSGFKGDSDKVGHYEKVGQWIADLVKNNPVFVVCSAQANKDDTVRWGNAIRMSADQLYFLKYNSEDKTAWLKMDATRYTPEMDIGSKSRPALRLHDKGQYFTDEEY